MYTYFVPSTSGIIFNPVPIQSLHYSQSAKYLFEDPVRREESNQKFEFIYVGRVDPEDRRQNFCAEVVIEIRDWLVGSQAFNR